MKFSEVGSGTHEIYGGQHGVCWRWQERAMRGRWAGGAFQVRSNSPIVFFPGGFETVPQKVGERGSEKTSGGANDQAILNAPETHLRKS